MSTSKTLKIAALGLLLTISISLKAQTFEGQIMYNINYLEVPAEMQGMESMLPQTLDMSIKGKNLAMKQSLMGGSQIILYNGETEESAVVMDMMGQKVAIMITAEEERKAREELGKPVLKYLDGTKKVAGYTCKKAIMTTGDQEVELWYTNEIKGAIHKDFTDLDGFPLEYLTYSQGMKLSIVAQSVSTTSPDASVFKVPEGYTKMTMQEFTNSMGGGY